MFAVILSLLGFALFDLAALESRLVMGSEADYRALEIAQAGMERAVHQLLLDLCGGSPSCATVPPDASWADGSPAALTSVGPPSFDAVLIGSTAALGGSFGGETYSGTYEVRLANLSQADAAAIGVSCSANPAGNCTDVIYVRSQGTFLSGIATSVTRTIQAVVRAGASSFGDGIIAGSPASGTISGNAEIHGSLHVLPCGSSPCTSLVFNGGAGMRNNYNGLASNRQNFIPRLPQITCPGGTQCAGFVVETLDASVRMAKPDDGTIDIGSNAITIGESGTGSTNGVTGVKGKPTMDGVYLGNGCQSADCSDQVLSRPQNVYTDRPIRDYDVRPPPSFPLLDAPITVFSRTYDDYAACSGAGVCNVSGAVVSGTGNDFFISHAAKIISTTTEDVPWSCQTVSGVGVCAAGTTENLFTRLGGGAGPVAAWTDTSPTWSFTFRCTGVGAIACDDADGNRVNGLLRTGATKPDGFQLEWHQPTQTISVYRCPVGQAGSECGAPTAVSAALGNISYGTRRYRVAYVDAGGNEFEISPPVTVTLFKFPPTGPSFQSQLTFTAPVGPPGTATRRLYRVSLTDGSVRRVATFATNLAAETQIDNTSDGNLGTQPLLSATLNEGLLSLTTADITADPTRTTLPIMIYVDGQLKICPDCNNKTWFYRGNAAIVAKGTAADTLANTAKTNFSIVIDAAFLACAPNAAFTDCSTGVDTSSFPKKNLVTLYTPGSTIMGETSQRDFFGQFYSGIKWETSKSTNVLGAVTARVFNITANVPTFWEVKMPVTATAFPPRGPRMGVGIVRWKQCVGTVPTGAC